MNQRPDSQTRYTALVSDPMLVRGGRAEPHWLDGGTSFAFVDGSAEEPIIKRVDSATGDLLMAIGVSAIAGQTRSWQPGQVALRVRDDGTLIICAGGKYFALSVQSHTSAELGPEAVSEFVRALPRPLKPSYPAAIVPDLEVLCPDRSGFLTIIDDDVWVRPRATGEPRRITSDGVPDYRWSAANATWSADCRYVALAKLDERTVYRVPLIDWTGEQRKIEWLPYPPAGGALVGQHLHLIDTTTGSSIELPRCDANTHAFNLGFSPDGKELRYAWMERTSKQVEVFAHNVAADRSRLLHREGTETFLYWPATFLRSGPPVHFLGTGEFIWQSEQSGWNQLYLHDADGKLRRQLSSPGFPVTNLIGIDEKSRTLFYRAQPHADRPYDVHLFKAALDHGDPRQLSSQTGTHEMFLAPDRAHYVDIHSALDRAPCSQLHDSDGGLRGVLLSADTSRLEALGWTAPEQFRVKALDGHTDIFGVLYKPYDFDPARNYPVLDSIYAGPQVCQTLNSFSECIFRGQQAAALAQLGYFVVMIDARGTPGRGKAFQDVVVGSMGDFEIAEHAHAIRQIGARYPCMDLQRAGLFGGSYGGYFTVRGLIQEPDFYKAGVAWTAAELGPCILGSAFECYATLPNARPELYARLPNTDKIDRIKGELLLISGTADVNTPFEHAMLYSAAFIRAGKPFDQVVMPGHNHWLADASGQMKIEFLNKLIARHFARTLQ